MTADPSAARLRLEALRAAAQAHLELVRALGAVGCGGEECACLGPPTPCEASRVSGTTRAVLAPWRTTSLEQDAAVGSASPGQGRRTTAGGRTQSEEASQVEPGGGVHASAVGMVQDGKPPSLFLRDSSLDSGAGGCREHLAERGPFISGRGAVRGRL